MSSTDPLAYGLPHREPFIFIDEVRELEPGVRALCTKTFHPDEAFFRGHFPGDPLVPGVILTEALAQTAGIAAGTPSSKKSYRLSAVKLMKFLRAVRPDELILLSAEKSAAAGALCQFQVIARVGEQTVAEGVIVLNEQ